MSLRAARPPSLSGIAPLLCLACSGWLACGSPAPAAAPDELHMELKDTAGERCLVSANVKRERKENEPAKITARQILVHHTESKNAKAGVKRTRGQACLRAQEALNKLTEGMDFEKAVAAYSDEAGAATRAGSVGTIERSMVVPEFADAAFELEPNQVSEVFESKFGFHVVMRME
ncbi:MAG: peptidylprolyl isomerase [Polyangiaceae bacterium]